MAVTPELGPVALRLDSTRDASTEARNESGPAGARAPRTTWNGIDQAAAGSGDPDKTPGGNCSDSRGNEGLKVENRGRIPVAYAQADGCQTAFDQFDPPSLNSYPGRPPDARFPPPDVQW